MKTWLIKCPNCGSSAKPERIYEDHTTNWKQKRDIYECGCGQKFEVIFEVTAFNLLKTEE